MKENLKKFRHLIISLGVFGLLIAVFAIGFYSPEAQEITKKDSVYEKFSQRDLVTDLIRDKSQDFLLIKTSNPNDIEKIKKIGTIVEDYGSIVVVAKNKTKDISGSSLVAQPLKTEINLPSGKFEPISNPPIETVKPNDRSLENTTGKDYYIVQLAGLTKDEWLESFREVGAEVVQYVPHQAFFVYGDGEAIQKIADHSRVRWVGKYVAEQKLSPQLDEFVGKIKGDRASFDVAVFSRANFEFVRDELVRTINGRVLAEQKLPHNFFNVIRVEMSPNDIDNVAKIKDVVRIDSYVKAVREDERAAQIVSGNYSSHDYLRCARL